MLYNTQWEKPEVKTEEEWRKTLLNAATVIEQFGWVRGTLGNKTIGFCTLGAVEVASSDRHGTPFTEALHHFSKHLQANHNSKSGCIETWNDKQAKNKTQVIRALRAAAEEGV